MSHNRIFSLLIVFMFFLNVSPLFAQESTSDEFSVKTIEYLVTAESANLRTGAGTNFGTSGQVIKGESILIYDETSQTSGWLRVYREGEEDAYIADFLVERAPVRFYPVDQEAILEVSGRGKTVTDIFDIPQGAYRIDASVQDNAFILQYVVIEGDCRDGTIFNELQFDSGQITMSGLFISQGCSVIFETDNVDNSWEFAVRDIIVDEEFLLKNILIIENDTKISGVGRALTMPTLISEGVWTISANVSDNAYILKAQTLNGDCSSSIFNEFTPGTNTLELSTVYRVTKGGCIIFWETSNVESEWEISFEKLR